jgi:hypothetical protein
MRIDVGSLLWWPVRSWGLEPGRAVANAQPSEAELEAQRTELRERVIARFAEQDRTVVGART